MQQFLCAREGQLLHDRRYRDLNPLLARPLVAGTVTTHGAAALPQRPRHALPSGAPRLAEARRAAIGRVAQHRPDGGAFPPGADLPRGRPLLVEPASDRRDAPARDDVVLVDVANNACFGLDHDVRRGAVLTLANVAITIGRTAQDADLTSPRAVQLPPTGPFENLSAFVLGDHALKLYQQLIFGRGARRAVVEAGLDPVTSELFDQQDLVGVLPAQPIRTVHEHHLDVTGGRQVPHPFQSRPFQRRPAIAVVFEDPLLRHPEIERHGPLYQCRRLARDRVRFALLVRGHARVYRRHLHVDPPFHRPARYVTLRQRQPDASGPAPATCRPGRACCRRADRTCNRAAPAAEHSVVVVHPRRWRKESRNAVTA